MSVRGMKEVKEIKVYKIREVVGEGDEGAGFQAAKLQAKV